MILLTKLIYSNIHKRYMHRTPGPRRIAALCHSSLSHQNVKNPTAILRNGASQHTQVRGMASLHAGRYKDKVFKEGTQTASSDATPEVQADCSGKHKNVVVTACAKPNCKYHNCAEGDNNPCGVSNEYHRTPLEEQGYTNTTFVHEHVGALTHKVPANKQGIFLSEDDCKGVAKPQYIVIEQGTMPVSPQELKTAVLQTDYVQQNDITTRIIKELPATSVINLPKKEIKTSICDAPLDDGF